VKPRAYVHWMPRVEQDIVGCIAFVAKHPAGRPRDRERDIQEGLQRIYSHPKSRRVEVVRAGVGFRRYQAAQFVIVYAYFEPSAVMPAGIVSIRAIRHRRVRDAFIGVRDGDPELYRFQGLGAYSARTRGWVHRGEKEKACGEGEGTCEEDGGEWSG
jgi:ParE toxin of type II toxin-antitoxin system, parDE